MKWWCPPELSFQSADGEMTPWLTRLAMRRYRSCPNAYLALISDCGGGARGNQRLIGNEFQIIILLL